MASSSKYDLALIGRLSGRKNEVALQLLGEVFPKVKDKIKKLKVVIVGGPVEKEHLELAGRFSFLEFAGHQDCVDHFYRRTRMIMGAGRVAIEAMRLKKPVICIGHSCYVGPISKKNYEYAANTNFGDWEDTYRYDWGQVEKDIISVLRSNKKQAQMGKDGYALVKDQFHIDKVYRSISKFYAESIFRVNLQKPKINILVEKIETRADLERLEKTFKKIGKSIIFFSDLERMTLRKKKTILILKAEQGLINAIANLLKAFNTKATILSHDAKSIFPFASEKIECAISLDVDSNAAHVEKLIERNQSRLLLGATDDEHFNYDSNIPKGVSAILPLHQEKTRFEAIRFLTEKTGSSLKTSPVLTL